MRSSWILRASSRARAASSSRPTPTSDSNPRPISPTTRPSTVTAAVPTRLTTARTGTSSRGRRNGRRRGARVLLADHLEELAQIRRGAVGPPGEPDRDGTRVADRAVDHAGAAVLGRGGLGGDADRLPGGDDGEPVVDPTDRPRPGG